MPTIFISHKTEDEPTVNRIHDTLTAAGIDAWVDHKKLETGHDWNAEIQKALHNCDAGLFVLSRASAQSPECEAEWRTILSRGIRLYVALIESVPQDIFPWRLNTIQYTDLAQNFDARMSDLSRAILNQQAVDPQSPTTKQARHVSITWDSYTTSGPGGRPGS